MKKHIIVWILFLVVFLISGCATHDTKQKAIKAKTPTPPKKIAIETSTTPSHYADQIIKDTRTGVEPRHIQIPAINVNATVIGVGRKKDGEMDVPGDGQSTGWYNLGFKPGEPGNAAIAGHVSSKRGPAVFFNLKKLKPGDEVIITGKGNERLIFEVIEVDSYPRLKAPLNKIFGYTSRSALNLITCSGKYDPVTTQNSERLVVYTQLKK